ncbi:hypothetical protein Pan216_21620 [Planctomycetes bacterium Pan216]|uniref:Uncharacterized protein n=1 Tax=Kolteria novifilia TaxID=2527975 RepID=A0A518B2U9_9BACT|nr:hypothetical protein Pan216_21620 [Planctomycetes bacterium Pan216]
MSYWKNLLLGIAIFGVVFGLSGVAVSLEIDTTSVATRADDDDDAESDREEDTVEEAAEQERN